MASNINTTGIDAAFPVAGTNNSTQGFRDNFASIKTNLDYAKIELSDLQSKVVLKSALNGQALNNDLSETVIANATLKSTSVAIEDLGEVAGAIELNFATSSHYVFTTTDSVTLSFADWPSSGVCGSIRLVITIGNGGHSLTLPAAAKLGLDNVSGAVSTVDGSGVITSTTISFPSGGVYVYDFETIDQGTTILVLDQSRSAGGGGGSVSIGGGSVPIATTSTLGIVKIGSGLAVSAQGLLTTNLASANLPIATVSVLGGVKVGSGISVAGDGTISVTGSSSAGISALRLQYYALGGTTNTFTVPAGVTRLRVAISSGYYNTGLVFYNTEAYGFVTVTPGQTITATVGAGWDCVTGGGHVNLSPSSFGSYLTAAIPTNGGSGAVGGSAAITAYRIGMINSITKIFDGGEAYSTRVTSTIPYISNTLFITNQASYTAGWVIIEY